MPGIEGRGDIAECIYQLGRPGQISSMSAPYRTSKPSILKQLSELTKGITFLLAICFLRMDSASFGVTTVMYVSQQAMIFCFVLFCFVLFCFVLFCFVLFCFVLFCFVLFCFVLFCFVLFG